jgi:hypothetical protein
MDSLWIPASEFTPRISFMPETGQFEISGISRPEDVAGFYQEPLDWLIRFEESILKSGHKYESQDLKISFRLSYFNSSSSKFIIQMLRRIKNLKERGMDISIDWYYEEGDEKMMEDGEDIADAAGLEFNYIEVDE